MHEYILYMHTHMCMLIYYMSLFMEMHIYAMCNYFWKKGVTPCLRAQTLEPGCECVCSVAQSCPILWDPMNCSPPGSSVYGALQARILEWVAMPSSRGIFLFTGRTRGSSVSCTGRQVLYCWSQAILVLTAVLILTLVMCCLGGLDGNFSVPQFLYL